MISVTSSSSAPLTDQPQLGMVQQAFLSPSPIMTPIILSPPYMAAMYQQQPFMVDLQQQHQQLSDDQQSRLAVPQQQQQQQQTSPVNSRRSSRRISKIPPVPPSLADIQFPKLMLNDHFISSDSPTSELAAPLSPQQQPRHRGSDAQYRSFQI
jgi:hypothetical protein